MKRKPCSGLFCILPIAGQSVHTDIYNNTNNAASPINSPSKINRLLTFPVKDDFIIENPSGFFNIFSIFKVSENSILKGILLS